MAGPGTRFPVVPSGSGTTHTGSGHDKNAHTASRRAVRDHSPRLPIRAGIPQSELRNQTLRKEVARRNRHSFAATYGLASNSPRSNAHTEADSLGGHENLSAANHVQDAAHSHLSPTPKGEPSRPRQVYTPGRPSNPSRSRQPRESPSRSATRIPQNSGSVSSTDGLDYHWAESHPFRVPINYLAEQRQHAHLTSVEGRTPRPPQPPVPTETFDVESGVDAGQIGSVNFLSKACRGVAKASNQVYQRTVKLSGDLSTGAHLLYVRTWTMAQETVFSQEGGHYWTRRRKGAVVAAVLILVAIMSIIGRLVGFNA